MTKINGIYYLSKEERDSITNAKDEKITKKWEKREVRNIEDYFYTKPNARLKNGKIGPYTFENKSRMNRQQRRQMKKGGSWRDGDQKTFSEHRTKKVLIKEQRRKKHKQNNGVK